MRRQRAARAKPFNFVTLLVSETLIATCVIRLQTARTCTSFVGHEQQNDISHFWLLRAAASFLRSITTNFNLTFTAADFNISLAWLLLKRANPVFNSVTFCCNFLIDSFCQYSAFVLPCKLLPRSAFKGEKKNLLLNPFV